jgi:hypothetical protein
LLYSGTEIIPNPTPKILERRSTLLEPSSQPVTLLSSIASILQAIAWPIAAILFFILYKTRIDSLIEVIAKKISTATRVKAWQVELDSTEQEISDVINRTGETASSESLSPKIPENQFKAAKEVNQKLLDSPLSVKRAVGVVQRQIQSLVEDYERTRAEHQSGPSRTRAMNEIAAKMRSLSLAARPLLHSLMQGQTHGERLVAICILQVIPDVRYFPWLIEQIKSEKQAFIFFQAALAVLELVQTREYPDKSVIEKGINEALQQIASFTGGTPDQNTIDVLNKALGIVR